MYKSLLQRSSRIACQRIYLEPAKCFARRLERCNISLQSCALLSNSKNQASVEFTKNDQLQVKRCTPLITGNVNRFTSRSNACGQVNDQLVGQELNLCGWVEFQRLGKFIVLRDCYGSVQLFIKDKQLQEIAKRLNLESVIQVKGKVQLRPAKDVNPDMVNGNVEVDITELTVLNQSLANMPILSRENINVTEKTRLEYRYLDLRRAKLSHNLRTRSNFIMSLRNRLVDSFGFVEVETPTLFKATPGGAQEFIVPTRFPGQFYSLVQSPQQFKQLLMIGGIDRYFQVARCYRDEGTKSDRQPEFTQLDIEMSFTSIDHVINLVEDLLVCCWPLVEERCQIEAPFKRMHYSTAMEKYGCDKPDLRSDMVITPLMDSANGERRHFLFVIPQEYDQSFTVKSFINEDLAVQVNTLNFKGQLYYFKWSSVSFQDSLDKSIISKLKNDFSFKDNDFLWIASGDKADCLRILGRIRASCIELIETDHTVNLGKPRKLSFLWVDDFPLFLPNEETGQLESSHHPFTAPKSGQTELVYSAPEQVIGQNFDLVINGREVGGGSIRIVDHDLQRYIFEKVLKSQTAATMDYFMEALRSGCPPHGGFAIGLDRLLALICQEPSIRDVIAFPKAAHGKDLMANSPGPIEAAVKKLYHI